MGWRYHRRVSLLPGLRVNLSRSGASVSIGSRGSWVTLGHGQRRMTRSVFRERGYRIPSSIRFRPFTAAISFSSRWWSRWSSLQSGGRRMGSVFDSIRGAGF